MFNQEIPSKHDPDDKAYRRIGRRRNSSFLAEGTRGAELQQNSNLSEDLSEILKRRAEKKAGAAQVTDITKNKYWEKFNKDKAANG